MALVTLALTPLLAFLAVPAALACQSDAATRLRRWGPATGVGLAVVLLAAVAGGLASTASTGDEAEVGGVPPMAAAADCAAGVAACALLAAALYAVPPAAGAPRAAGQCLAGFAAVLLLGTPFYMNPVIEGATAAGRGTWLAFTAGANPALVLLHAAAGIDALRAPVLYRLSVCQYYNYAYPTAWGLTGSYAAAALGLGSLAVAVRAMRRRLTDKT